MKFGLVDAHTVKRLVIDGDIKLPAKKVNIPKDMRWNTKQLNSAVLQGILQGDSMQKIAKRVFPIVNNNASAAIRNARTMVTGAECAGRNDSYKDLESRGVVLKKVWIATPDGRTRESHLEMDGEEVDVDEAFSNGCMYPGDPNGDPSEVYNCRCTMRTHIVGFMSDDGSISEIDFEREETLHDRQMEEERERREIEAEDPEEESTIVNGKDISETWERRPDKFDFEIEDIINAQGFDGLPRVVSADEFETAVKAANGGKGFIAQRTYSAETQEIVDTYHKELYNGKWYVDCSTGGAQYGQGMYCAADYSGTLSEGIKSEMNHYLSLQDTRLRYDRDQEIVDAQYRYANEKKQEVYNNVTDPVEQAMLRREILRTGTSEDRALLRGLSDEEYEALYKKMAEVNDSATAAYNEVRRMSMEEIARKFNIQDHAPNYVETITLDPSAKIITYKELLELEKTSDRKFEDIGSFAVAMGYDAINAEGHGKSGSYTVILNRTKVIFKGGLI